jgi:hypothetical protein
MFNFKVTMSYWVVPKVYGRFNSFSYINNSVGYSLIDVPRNSLVKVNSMSGSREGTPSLPEGVPPGQVDINIYASRRGLALNLLGRLRRTNNVPTTLIDRNTYVDENAMNEAVRDYNAQRLIDNLSRSDKEKLRKKAAKLKLSLQDAILNKLGINVENIQTKKLMTLISLSPNNSNLEELFLKHLQFNKTNNSVIFDLQKLTDELQNKPALTLQNDFPELCDSTGKISESVTTFEKAAFDKNLDSDTLIDIVMEDGSKKRFRWGEVLRIIRRRSLPDATSSGQPIVDWKDLAKALEQNDNLGKTTPPVKPTKQEAKSPPPKALNPPAWGGTSSSPNVKTNSPNSGDESDGSPPANPAPSLSATTKQEAKSPPPKALNPPMGGGTSSSPNAKTNSGDESDGSPPANPIEQLRATINASREKALSVARKTGVWSQLSGENQDEIDINDLLNLPELVERKAELEKTVGSFVKSLNGFTDDQLCNVPIPTGLADVWSLTELLLTRYTAVAATDGRKGKKLRMSLQAAGKQLQNALDLAIQKPVKVSVCRTSE